MGNPFAMLIDQIEGQSNKLYRIINKTEFEQWKKEFSFDALHGLRYGQSFCNKFEITDNILFFQRDPEYCDNYIEENYID